MQIVIFLEQKRLKAHKNEDNYGIRIAIIIRKLFILHCLSNLLTKGKSCHYKNC